MHSHLRIRFFLRLAVNVLENDVRNIFTGPRQNHVDGNSAGALSPLGAYRFATPPAASGIPKLLTSAGGGALCLGVTAQARVVSEGAKVFLEIYPNMPDDWYSTFLNQAEAIKNKIGSNNWKYGWYDGTQGWAKGVIPDNKVSYIMTDKGQFNNFRFTLFYEYDGSYHDSKCQICTFGDIYYQVHAFFL